MSLGNQKALPVGRINEEALLTEEFNKESTRALAAALPPLIKCSVISWSNLVVISALPSLGCAVMGFKKTSLGSASECSALKVAGSPMTTELFSSGRLTHVV
ncbi:MAG: hypothetical protein ACJ71U_06280 [Terriglobales bacterium]